MYAIVILVMRIMGKRQIGQLQPYEFVIAIIPRKKIAQATSDKAGAARSSVETLPFPVSIISVSKV